MTEVAAGRPRLAYSKALEVEDFSDSDLRQFLDHPSVSPGEVQSPGVRPSRRRWRMAMQARALRDLHPAAGAAAVLAVGCRLPSGSLLCESGMETESPRLAFAAESVDAVLQHLDLNLLGGFSGVAGAAWEAGRVLKPGGVWAVTFEARVAGPAGRIRELPLTALSPAETGRYVVEASGLAPMTALPACAGSDGRDFSVSPATLAAPRGVIEYGVSLRPRERDDVLVGLHNGWVSTLVHLVLGKTESYPAGGPSWARPPESWMADSRLAGMSAGNSARQEIERLFERWDAVRARSELGATAPRTLPGRLGGFLRRTLRRVRDLGAAWDRERDLLRALTDHQIELGRRQDLQAQGGTGAEGSRDDGPEIIAKLDALRREVAALEPLRAWSEEISHVREELAELREMIESRDS